MRNFRQYFAFALLAVITGSMVFLTGDKEMMYLIIGALVGAFSNVVSHFFSRSDDEIKRK